jgi:hypothetical protein
VNIQQLKKQKIIADARRPGSKTAKVFSGVLFSLCVFA